MRKKNKKKNVEEVYWVNPSDEQIRFHNLQFDQKRWAYVHAPPLSRNERKKRKEANNTLMLRCAFFGLLLIPIFKFGMWFTLVYAGLAVAWLFKEFSETPDSMKPSGRAHESWSKVNQRELFGCIVDREEEYRRDGYDDEQSSRMAEYE